MCANLSGTWNHGNSKPTWKALKKTNDVREVSSYINRHLRGSGRTAKADLGYSKELNSLNSSKQDSLISVQSSTGSGTLSWWSGSTAFHCYILFEKHPIGSFFSQPDHFPNECFFCVEGKENKHMFKFGTQETLMRPKEYQLKLKKVRFGVPFHFMESMRNITSMNKMSI